MATTLLVLHGYTMSGVTMRQHLGELDAQLSASANLEYLDAPLVVSDAAVDSFYSTWRIARPAPPHFSFWNASDDARIYQGFEETRDRIRAAMLAAKGNVGILGFSQGAIATAAIAALAAQGELPPLAFAIMVAGRVPRADTLAPLFTVPIQVPSLHVWGTADPYSSATAPLLFEAFEPSTRRIATFPGSHRVPTRGPAAAAIVDFVRERAG